MLEAKLDTSTNIQDISWLWRTAYNTAVQACLDWEGYEDSISDLFNISRQVSCRIYITLRHVSVVTGMFLIQFARVAS